MGKNGSEIYTRFARIKANSVGSHLSSGDYTTMRTEPTRHSGKRTGIQTTLTLAGRLQDLRIG